jgi:hypothetical protein
MSREFSEADWRVLRQLEPVALERVCQRVLSEIGRLASDTEQGAHERYLEIYQLLRRRDSELARIFNGLRRSNALIRLACMHSHELLRSDELARFSPETREALLAIVGR